MAKQKQEFKANKKRTMDYNNPYYVKCRDIVWKGLDRLQKDEEIFDIYKNETVSETFAERQRKVDILNADFKQREFVKL